MTTSVALAYFMTEQWRLAQRFGVVMIVIIIGLLLGNLGIISQSGEIYNPLMGHIIPISIALLLFRLDFQSLRNLKGDIVLYYFIGIFGSILGSVIAWLLFADKIGPDAMRLTGQLSASYIGGGENAVAVAEALGLRGENFNLFSAAFAADNIVTAIWMMVALSAPFGFSRFFSNEISQEQLDAAKENTPPFTASTLLPSSFYALALAGIIVWASAVLAKPIRMYALEHGLQWLNFDTSIIWVTTLSLLIAQTPLRKRLQASYTLGMLLFLYFFFSMGAISSIEQISELGPMVFVFAVTIVGVHALVVLAAAYFLKGDMASVFVASQCNIGGPATAVALAEANGWQHLVVPSILLGVLGYAIANYFGIIIAQFILPFLAS